MKDITIRASSMAREFKIWGFLVILALLTNAYAILEFEGQWSELYSQLHVILILSVIYYVIVLLLRGAIGVVRFLYERSSKSV